MLTPEELARENIDRQLTACGWTVQSRNEINLYAARGVAVREFPLERGKQIIFCSWIGRQSVWWRWGWHGRHG